jgi:hypothetical protein
MSDDNGELSRWFLFRHKLQYSGYRPLKWLGTALYRFERRVQGARAVDMGGYSETAGSLRVEGARGGVDISWSGACPVQGWGTVDGHICYYRSRGEGWEFCVAAEPGGNPDDEAEMQVVFDAGAWEHHERPYMFPDGGWVKSDVSRHCILKGIALWRGSTSWWGSR